MALPYTYTLNGHHSPSFNLLLNKWMGSIAATTYKPLASLLADKCCTSYGQTMHRVSFSYLRSSIQCIRGAHDSIQWACYTPFFLHRTYSQWICMNTYIFLLNTYSHSPMSQHYEPCRKLCYLVHFTRGWTNSHKLKDSNSSDWRIGVFIYTAIQLHHCTSSRPSKWKCWYAVRGTRFQLCIKRPERKGRVWGIVGSNVYLCRENQTIEINTYICI